MKQRICVVGFPGKVAQAHLKSTEEIYSAYGRNSGNLAFQYAVNQHLLNYEIDYVGWRPNMSLINERCQSLVLVAANWIGRHTDLKLLADIVEACELPIAVIGLGAQAGIGATSTHIPKGTASFLRKLCEKSAVIGARGDFTHKILTDFGLTNVHVIGCPSNFINASPTLGVELEDKLHHSCISRIAFNFDLTGRSASHVHTFVRWLTDRSSRTSASESFHASGLGGSFIVQNPIEAIHLARNEFSRVSREYLQQANNVICPDIDEADFLSFCSTYVHSYYDAEAWMAYLSTCNLSLGSRLHGNMLAIAAGTPAVMIPHDSRTSELVNTLMVPYTPLQSLKEDMTIGSFLDAVIFDGSIYDGNRKKLFARYQAVMASIGIDIADLW